ncbi:MAG: phenylacetate--CoA ligase, partial [Cytophagales bacterium]|nr:phenylacetate--CoA ligase [Cytophagales bacterium]
MKNQWGSPSQLADIQHKKLQALIHHAYARVPYYRKLFDTIGAKPEDIRTTDDLAAIP